MSDAAWGAIGVVLAALFTGGFTYLGVWLNGRQRARQLAAETEATRLATERETERETERQRQATQLAAQQQEFIHLRDIIDELIERVDRAETRATRADERADRAEARANRAEQALLARDERETELRTEIDRLKQEIRDLRARYENGAT